MRLLSSDTAFVLGTVLVDGFVKSCVIVCLSFNGVITAESFVPAVTSLLVANLTIPLTVSVASGV